MSLAGERGEHDTRGCHRWRCENRNRQARWNAGRAARHPARAAVLSAAMRRAGIPAAEINEVIVGQAVQAGAGINPARQAALAAGVPISGRLHSELERWRHRPVPSRGASGRGSWSLCCTSWPIAARPPDWLPCASAGARAWFLSLPWASSGANLLSAEHSGSHETLRFGAAE
jgi:hypothetical protein